MSTMLDALARLSAPRRAKLLTFVALLAPLVGLPVRARESILRALADAPLAPLRTGFQAFKRLALFSAYAVADEDARNPLWPLIGYPGPRGDRPMPTFAVPTIVGARGTRDADVVVIGSGAGGGVTAGVLAQSGLRTIVLEAGPAPEPTAALQREAEAFAALYLESGLAATDDLGISILAGACVGGGTTVNWSTSLRLPDAVAEQWRVASGGDSFDLADDYAAVEARLGVVAAHAHNRNNGVIVRGSSELGWNATDIPRNADICGDRGGYCGFGCAYACKRSTARTYLADAVDAGAEIFAETRAQRVRIERGRVVGVDAGELSIDAPLVIVAAGTLRTPGVLARSGIVSPHLGRHLHLHPTTALTAEFDEPIDAWLGAMQTALCDRFAHQADGYGATIETAPAHPGLMALSLPWRSRAQHSAEMKRVRYAATLIVLTRDRGEGSVALDGSDDVRYTLANDDAGRMIEALIGTIDLAFAAGARRVATLHTIPLELSREHASAAERARFAAAIRARGAAPNRLGVFSAHQMGTARMHRDPASGVVDSFGRVHGTDGLLVADASVFPLASGVNPMLTIMALAHRAARTQRGVRLAVK